MYVFINGVVPGIQGSLFGCVLVVGSWHVLPMFNLKRLWGCFILIWCFVFTMGGTHKIIGPNNE